MAEDWRLCADWLVRCQILAPEHPAAKPTGQLQNLAAVLRDGVLMCLLLDRLHPGAVDQRDFSPHPQVSLVHKHYMVFDNDCRPSTPCLLLTQFNPRQLCCKDYVSICLFVCCMSFCFYISKFSLRLLSEHVMQVGSRAL